MTERRYWFWMEKARHPGDIVREVAKRHNLTIETLKGPCRASQIVRARNEAIWELRENTQLSFIRIAQMVGRTDSTTAWRAYHNAKAARG